MGLKWEVEEGNQAPLVEDDGYNYMTQENAAGAYTPPPGGSKDPRNEVSKTDETLSSSLVFRITSSTQLAKLETWNIPHISKPPRVYSFPFDLPYKIIPTSLLLLITPNHFFHQNYFNFP